VAYQLELPPELSDVHDVFHVSQLKECLRVPEEQIPFTTGITETSVSQRQMEVSPKPTEVSFFVSFGLTSVR
jgi:hypothetical protein